MLVGFIHGVMNTDNMAISGETIDYGPCAFMDSYDPKTVFSSIDHNGRYAYANQPVIAQWNLARFAETLLVLIDPDAKKAVALATEVLESLIPQFEARFLAGMRRKIGLSSATEGDADLVRRLLTLMRHSQADFTLTFRRLALVAENPAEESQLRELFAQASELHGWLRDWRERLASDPQAVAERVASMREASPAFIPRNHRVQAALDAADAGDYSLFRKLLGICLRPYDDQAELSEYSQPPQASERVLQTFCGT
jgi:uncharacterized protein YdiU (UPF0061 family)